MVRAGNEVRGEQSKTSPSSYQARLCANPALTPAFHPLKLSHTGLARPKSLAIQMNERLKLESGEGDLNDCLWVELGAA